MKSTATILLIVLVLFGLPLMGLVVAVKKFEHMALERACRPVPYSVGERPGCVEVSR